MLTMAITLAYVLIGLAVLCTLFRLVRGPSRADRLLAFDTLCVNVLALILVHALDGGAMYLEAALLLALFGFLGTAVLARTMISGKAME